MAEKYIGMIEVGDIVMHIVHTTEKRQVPIGDSPITREVAVDVLQAGTYCNLGLIPYYTHDLDPVFSFDENLNAFVDYIHAQEESNG